MLWLHHINNEVTCWDCKNSLPVGISKDLARSRSANMGLVGEEIAWTTSRPTKIYGTVTGIVVYIYVVVWSLILVES
jgi:hypothetical protein